MKKILRKTIPCSKLDMIEHIYHKQELLNDGRLTAMIQESMALECWDLVPAPLNTPGYDGYNNVICKSEIKCCTENKSYKLGSSSMHGQGRKFNKDKAINDYRNIDTLILGHHTNNTLDMFVIPTDIIIKLLYCDMIGGTITHNSILKKLRQIGCD
jgi:hypothetical protein